MVVLSGPEGVYQCRFFAQNGKVKDLRSQERPQTRPSNTNNLHVSFSWSLLVAFRRECFYRWHLKLLQEILEVKGFADW